MHHYTQFQFFKPNSLSVRPTRLSQNANVDKVTFGNPYNLFELRSNRLKRIEHERIIPAHVWHLQTFPAACYRNEAPVCSTLASSSGSNTFLAVNTRAFIQKQYNKYLFVATSENIGRQLVKDEYQG
jgi:hypothetical protein